MVIALVAIPFFHSLIILVLKIKLMLKINPIVVNSMSQVFVSIVPKDIISILKEFVYRSIHYVKSLTL